MKKIYLVLLMAAVLAGCSENRLNIPEKGVVSETDYFQTDDDCVAATAAMYQSMIRTSLEESNPLWLNEWFLNLLADDVVKGSSGWKWDDFHYLQMYNYTSSQKYVQEVYKYLFIPVSRANTVIEHFGNDTSAVKRQAVAEAKVLRSFVYLKLIGYWGNPPIIDHVLRNSEDYEQPNATTEALWEFVIGSLNEAIASKALVSKKGVDDRTCTRITLEFAYAVKGKAEVMAGRYADAKQSLKKVMDSGLYALVPGNELADKFFSTEGDFNSETLFESNVVYSESLNFKEVSPYDKMFCYCGLNASKYKMSDDCWFKPFGSNGWQYFPPTEKIVNAMLAHDGRDSYRFKAWFWSYEDLLSMGVKNFEDYRSEALETGDVPTGYKDNCTQPEGCGYWNRKFTGKGYEEWCAGNNRQDEVNRRWMRYAEVLLLYAEACAQTGDADGLAALLTIQERAGVPAEHRATALTMDAVKQEKWFEMWDEGCRYVDLVRWGDAAVELGEKATHHSKLPVFMGYCKDANGQANGEYFIRYIDLDALNGTSYSFKKGRDEHLPFPDTELANNKNLRQNAGWE